jgi:hypothetical protein
MRRKWNWLASSQSPIPHASLMLRGSIKRKPLCTSGIGHYLTHQTLMLLSCSLERCVTPQEIHLKRLHIGLQIFWSGATPQM